MTLTAEIGESAEDWSLRAYLPDNLRAKVAAADILFVPSEGYVDRADFRFFPSTTTDFVNFIERSVPVTTAVEVCIGDEEYREVARHADLLYVVGVVVKLLAAPLFVNLLAEYIKRKVGNKKTSETTLKTSITVVDQNTDRSVRLDYDGPADTFESTLLSAVRQIQAGATVEEVNNAGSTRQRAELPSNLSSSRRKKRRK